MSSKHEYARGMDDENKSTSTSFSNIIYYVSFKSGRTEVNQNYLKNMKQCATALHYYHKYTHEIHKAFSKLVQ